MKFVGFTKDGRIAPRSGLAAKHFIDTGAGVIDADYRGEVKVLLFNFSDVDFEGTSIFFPLNSLSRMLLRLSIELSANRFLTFHN